MQNKNNRNGSTTAAAAAHKPHIESMLYVDRELQTNQQNKQINNQNEWKKQQQQK